MKTPLFLLYFLSLINCGILSAPQGLTDRHGPTDSSWNGIPFLSDILGENIDWESPPPLRKLSIGRNVCQDLIPSDHPVVLLWSRGYFDRVVSKTCFDLEENTIATTSTGDFVPGPHEADPGKRCNYLSWIESLIHESQRYSYKIPELAQHFSNLANQTKIAMEGLSCEFRIQENPKATTVPTVFLARALSNGKSDFVAELVDDSHKMISIRQRLTSIDEYVKIDLSVPQLQDVEATLYYGIVSPGASLDQASAKGSHKISFPRMDIYKAIGCRFEYGKNATCIIEYDVESQRKFMLFSQTIRGEVVPGSGSVYPGYIYLKPGKGTFDISQYFLDPKIFKKGESYRLVIAPFGLSKTGDGVNFFPAYVPFVAE